MPSLKTECTELALAFGILNRDPLHIEELPALFDGTLSPERFQGVYERLVQKYQAIENSFLLKAEHQAAQVFQWGQEHIVERA